MYLTICQGTCQSKHLYLVGRINCKEFRTGVSLVWEHNLVSIKWIYHGYHDFRALKIGNLKNAAFNSEIWEFWIISSTRTRVEKRIEIYFFRMKSSKWDHVLYQCFYLHNDIRIFWLQIPWLGCLRLLGPSCTPVLHTIIDIIMSTTIPRLVPPSSLLKTTSAKPIHSASSQTPPLKEDSYFGASIYTSPEHSDNYNSDEDDGRSDSTLEDECSEKLFGHPLERMPRIKSADHGFQYEQDLNSLLLTSRSFKSESVISTTSDASYGAM